MLAPISRLCLGIDHLASRIAGAAVILCPRSVVVNNGGFGRRITLSFYYRGPGYLYPAGPGSLPGPSVRSSLQVSVGETDQTRKVELGRLRAACGRAEARQHRPCVKRRPVPVAPARGGGEVQPSERCGVRLQQQRWGELISWKP